GEEHFACLARRWNRYYEEALAAFEALGGDVVEGFRRFEESGQIEIVSCCATHGYLPLLGTDESVRAQVETGVATHTRHLGRAPRGMWIPECGYRPAGNWQTPVVPQGRERAGAARPRMGIEQALAEAGIGYFFVDTHLVEQALQFTPYEPAVHGGAVGAAAALPEPGRPSPSVCRTYVVEGPSAGRVTAFPRDPRTGVQVWSGTRGYPGDPNYLDFHKKRWPGGHRYWQVTEARADLEMKTPYYPERAAARTRAHAEHFVSVVYDSLRESLNADRPPVLSAPFDAELFGHWWFEGPSWLEQVARIVAEDDFPIALMTGGEYAERVPAEGSLALAEGSWGKNGGHEVWLNERTAWTWAEIYAAEEQVRTLASEGRWREDGLGRRIAQQMCRELLLLESSDWQFLITTEAARDYAEGRFTTHLEQFREVDQAWQEWAATGILRPETENRLAQIEERDSIFADVDPGLWERR
ncbi:MAG: 1,4-alpha-glucan branching protein domain-containing protein, partial [Acidobacteriaceae bacterium]